MKKPVSEYTIVELLMAYGLVSIDIATYDATWGLSEEYRRNVAWADALFAEAERRDDKPEGL
jgi:hypothetical protein